MKDRYTITLSGEGADLDTVGGKGASLAKMAARGLPVPAGFHVTTHAYRRFVEANDLQAEIDAALRSVRMDAPRSFERASETIRGRFASASIPADIVTAISEAYDRLTASGGDRAVAVRSSATAEDLPQASFAGQQDTFLNVSGAGEVVEAVRKCWASLWTARAIGYRARHGFEDAGVALAVVVQRMVPAETAGILFTANPVNGRGDQAVISASWGLGETVVGGGVTPDTLVVEKSTGTVISREVGQKLVQSVAADRGTAQAEVPEELQNAPVLENGQAADLVGLGARVEALFDSPQDIEWAFAGERFVLLQSRPITTLPAADAAMAEHNVTLAGDYLWTNMIVGEIFPTAVTPATWSVWEDVFNSLSFGDVPGIGDIAGRPYLNYSLTYSFLLKLFRKHERVMDVIEDTIGTPPDDVEIPSFPVPWQTILFQVIPSEFGKELKKNRLKNDVPAYLESVRERCRVWKGEIAKAQGDQLVSLWVDKIRPLWQEIHLLQDGVNEDLQGKTRSLKADLSGGEADIDANRLLTTIRTGELASLGPVLGLAKVHRGELTRREYLQRYGHRGTNENELAEPRPYEDEGWLDEGLADLSRSPVDLEARLGQRRREFQDRQREIGRELSPKKAQRVIDRLDEVVATNIRREAVRSEVTRVVDVIRALFLRGGELTGLGEDVFFLEVGELVEALTGEDPGDIPIAERQETHERLKSLPPLPAWIRGRFDPFVWAADPNRPRDVYDASSTGHRRPPDGEKVIQGQPGSAGRVEGLVRRVDHPGEGEQLETGEVLVTSTTNVGWTPLFPRTAAVVTDIGGSLSHAAIVARELGIPAVVGCRDATLRLHTGDRVRVDGARGTVEVLERAGDTSGG